MKVLLSHRLENPPVAMRPCPLPPFVEVEVQVPAFGEREPVDGDDFRAIPRGLVVGSVQTFRANGSDFTVELTVRADASEHVLEDLGTILESIRPVSLTTGETLNNGYVVLDASLVISVGSSSVIEAAESSFLVIHAPRGYYVLGLPDEVAPSSEFLFDGHEQQVVWAQDGELFARFDREARLWRVRPGRVWCRFPSTPWFSSPGAQYGPLPDEMWGS